MGVSFDPAAALDAATRLDGLADRLAADLRISEGALTVAPAGRDEVSERAAATMTSVADSFGETAAAGINELRKVAAELRAQTDRFGRMESENAAEFGGVGPVPR
ncbi:PE family protein [Nocardia sp. NPDC051787]|uniref:PE family protein n=1 Tax=Nocardia sp. NPDC051787 TaxID=3155415 RepID=UPI00344375FB